MIRNFPKFLFDILKCCWCLHDVDQCLLISLNYCNCFKREYYPTDVYMSKCNCCVLLSKYIHVLMHLLCWIYSHPLLDCTLTWYRHAARRNLVAVSLGGLCWRLLLFVYWFWEF